MFDNYIVLIDYTDCSTGYQEFETLALAKDFVTNVLELDEFVEYAQIIKAESQYCWANPNCASEKDF